VSEDATEPTPSDEPLGSGSSSEADIADGSKKPSGSRRVVGMVLLAAFALVVVVIVVVGVGTWGASRMMATVPDVSGLSAPLAVERILASNLATSAIAPFVTSAYRGGLVLEQAPAQSTKLPVGSGVNLRVAVPPTTTVVPDVSLELVGLAQGNLGSSLLGTTIYEQLSDSVDFGRVVSQMPRAGQPITTGQPVVLFVSMGRGTGGAVVPNVVGLPLVEAEAQISSVYLIAAPYGTHPVTNTSAKVTDQVPAPGTRVPIGSAVPLVVGGTTN
jgi:beta-lactam-binding protein with PASTA domain